MKAIRRAACVIFALLITCTALSAAAAGDLPDFENYIYSNSGSAVYAPAAYSLKKTVYASDMGIDGIGSVADAAVSSSGEVFVLDREKCRMIGLTPEFKLFAVYENYIFGGETVAFNTPEGLSVTADGELCICDTGNSRVVLLNKSGETLKVIGPPEDDNGLLDYKYYPQKAAVDNTGRLIVNAKDQTQGLMVFDANGGFTGYMGATPVKTNAAELFWRSFSTKEQRRRAMRFVPSEYNNIDIDENGFIFVTSYSAQKIRRLNPGGKNVLKTNAYYNPYGDLETGIRSLSQSQSSTIVDVSAGPDGVYSILSQNTGRVFTYDSGGNLLYIFGGKGSAANLLSTPTALCYRGTDIIVAEQDAGCLKLFSSEEYAEDILTALRFHTNGDYEKEKEAWERVLVKNNNYELAYQYLGKLSYITEDYKEAMRYFKYASDKEGYSKALSRQLAVRGEKAILPVCIAAGILAAAALLFYILKKTGRQIPSPGRAVKRFAEKRRVLRELKYALYACSHPFDGFWEIKAENRCGALSATVILLFCIITNIVYSAGLPFLFAGDASGGNLITNGVFSVAFLPLVWCVSNWSFTTLTDGKGTFKNIYVYTVVSLIPRSLSQLAALIVSQVITLDASAFFNMLLVIGTIWTVFLLFAGTAVTHQYSAGKTVGSILLILIGVVIILFILLVAITLIQKMGGFFNELITEFSIRI